MFPPRTPFFLSAVGGSLGDPTVGGLRGVRSGGRAAPGPPSVALRRTPETLRRGLPALLLEPPLPGRGGRLGRSPRAPDTRRLPELLDDAVGGELAVAELRSLVLGDRAHDRAEPLEHPAALGGGQRLRCRHVE